MGIDDSKNVESTRVIEDFLVDNRKLDKQRGPWTL